jgi:hypothetical protein
MKNLVNEVLKAAVGNHFRAKLQSMPAIAFIEKRQDIQGAGPGPHHAEIEGAQGPNTPRLHSGCRVCAAAGGGAYHPRNRPSAAADLRVQKLAQDKRLDLVASPNRRSASTSPRAAPKR